MECWLVMLWLSGFACYEQVRICYFRSSEWLSLKRKIAKKSFMIHVRVLAQARMSRLSEKTSVTGRSQDEHVLLG